MKRWKKYVIFEFKNHRLLDKFFYWTHFYVWSEGRTRIKIPMKTESLISFMWHFFFVVLIYISISARTSTKRIKQVQLPLQITDENEIPRSNQDVHIIQIKFTFKWFRLPCSVALIWINSDKHNVQSHFFFDFCLAVFGILIIEEKTTVTVTGGHFCTKKLRAHGWMMRIRTFWSTINLKSRQNKSFF